MYRFLCGNKFLFLKIFIYFERAREREEKELAFMSRGRTDRKGERESQADSVFSVAELGEDLIPQTSEIST